MQAHDGWNLAAAALALATEGGSSPAVQNVLLYGPPGTGKSYFAQRYGLARGGAEVLPGERLCRVYLTEEPGRRPARFLDPGWQAEQTRRMRAIYGERRVLHGQRAFASLAAPHRVC